MSGEFFLPTILTFEVEQVSAYIESFIHENQIKSKETICLTLRLDENQNIQLASGLLLSDIAFNFSLSDHWKSPSDLAADLPEDCLGFLVNTVRSAAEPMVHGAAIVTDLNLARSLLDRNLRAKVIVSTPTIAQRIDSSQPFIWHTNRAHRLVIQSLRIELTH
ncbi:hypothetical protein [Herbaspirillum huttiense]|uniref:hypothetical protein n=1 Tax=Herbaspirillum huttiense TaxID=863372 RepID=UPI0023F562A1|nr:hypothetical protein [Herbaspirillum huttiense]